MQVTVPFDQRLQLLSGDLSLQFQVLVTSLSPGAFRPRDGTKAPCFQTQVLSSRL
jgi:hypothetical protein